MSSEDRFPTLLPSPDETLVSFPIEFTPSKSMAEPTVPAASYKSSIYYFRRALREAQTRERAQTVGLVVCFEHERLRAWCREQGLIPPKWIVDPQEAEDKGWEVGA